MFEPHFTVHGYRYVELTGFPGTPTADSITGLAAWTDGAETGTFTTSDPLVNQLQHNILWGARSNMLSIPTDCPQRDERLGWTGDIAAFGATSTFNFDTHGLLDKFADDLVDAQRADGAFTDVAPGRDRRRGQGRLGRRGRDRALHGVAALRRPVRGRTSTSPRMARWVDYLRVDRGRRPDPQPRDVRRLAQRRRQHRQRRHQHGVLRLVGPAASRGWRRPPGAPRRRPPTARSPTRSAAAFTSRFVAADGTVGSNSQTGYVLALAFGLVPPNRTQAVADKLAAKVASRNGHLSVGFMGVENLLPVLAEHGHLDTAYQILQQPDYPGWGYMNSRGATTIWERWDGIRTDGSPAGLGHELLQPLRTRLGRRLALPLGRRCRPGRPGLPAAHAPRPGGTLTSATTALTRRTARRARSGAGAARR